MRSLTKFAVLMLWSALPLPAVARVPEDDVFLKPAVRELERGQLLAEHCEGSVRLVLIDREPRAKPWLAGQTRLLHLLAVNAGDAPIQVPDNHVASPVFGWGAVVWFNEDPSRAGVHGFQRGLTRAGFPDTFMTIQPGESIGIGVSLVPKAPGDLKFAGVVANQWGAMTTWRNVRTDNGGLRATATAVAVPNAWKGRVTLEHRVAIAADPPEGWEARRTSLTRLFSDRSTSDERRQKEFSDVVARDNWWTWQLCCEALDRPAWREVHEAARGRLLKMFSCGMPGVDWAKFVRDLDEKPQWSPLRSAAIPLIEEIAERHFLEGREPGDVSFFPSVATAADARAVLEKWANESSGEVASAARAAIDDMLPIPPASIDRGIAGKPPGPPLPSPIAMPTGRVDGVVKASIYWSMYYLAAKVEKALAKVAPAVHVEIYGRDKEAEWDGFDRGQSDVYMLAHDPRFLDALLRERYPDPSPWPSSYWLGDSVACVVVHPRNPIAALDTTTLRHIFFASDAPGWDIAGGRPIQINRYVEAGGRTGEVVKAVIGGGSSYENNKTVACQSPAEILEKVGGDPNAIGFMRFGSDAIKAEKKVKIIAIQRDTAQGKGVLPSMETISDGSYPLCERMTLLARPDASPATKAFLSVASHLDWKTIGDDSGFWPTSEIRRWREEQRLEQLKAGKAKKVTAIGPRAGEKIVGSLCLDLTRREVAVKPAYSVAKDADGLRRFMAGEADFLVSEGALSSESLEPYAKVLTGFKLRSVPLGRSTMALIIHPAHKLDSITIDQLREILSGTVREWSSESPGGRIIKRFGPPAADDGLLWLADRLGVPVRSMKLEHRRTAADVLAAVAAEPQAIGIVTLGDVPAEPPGVAILPVAVPSDDDGKGKVLRPDDAGYPFARQWFIHTHGRASPAARLLIERIPGTGP
jgi:phosphate transport system substrate-binding protein